MTISLAGCGKGKEEKAPAPVEEKEYVYVPEYLELDEDMRLYNVRFVGNSIYYFNSTYDEQTQEYEEKFCEYSLTEKRIVSELSLEGMQIKSVTPAMGVAGIAMPVGAQADTPADAPGGQDAGAEAANRNVSAFQVLGDGSIFTVENAWSNAPMATDKQKLFLCSYDKEGRKTSEKDLSEVLDNGKEYGVYVESMLVDGEGRVYLYTGDGLKMLNPDGSYQGELKADNGWIRQICMGKDGKVYVAYYDNALSDGGTSLAEVDFAGKKWGTVYKNFPDGGSAVAGGEKDFLVRSSTAVYAYDLASQSAEKLFDWLDSDINGDHVENFGILEDGRIAVLEREWNTGQTSLALLSKKKVSEQPGKTTVVLGILYDDQELRAAAAAFNKSSDTYRVTIRNYIDESAKWTENAYGDAQDRLNSDLVSATNSPDVICFDGRTSNVEKLAKNGAYEDLASWMEKSSAVKKDDYLENILDYYTYGGKLVGLPRSFAISTIVGKTSDVGKERGWTMDEMIAFADAHPDNNLFEYGTRSFIFNMFVNYGAGRYVDYETGKCSFDSEEFQKLLTFAKKFPNELNVDNGGPSLPARIQAGDVLLNMTHISDLNEIQLNEAMFGEPVTYIGYPTADGGSGCVLNPQMALGIAAKAGNKEGAWAFVESWLLRESDMFFSGFSARKSALKAALEKEVAPKYLTDENGNPVLDKDGNPIAEGGGSGIGYGDWNYTFRTPTQAEADLVMELITSARPRSASDDKLLGMILEDAQPFFQGQKSAADVAGIIQNRVQLYLDENQ